MQRPNLFTRSILVLALCAGWGIGSAGLGGGLFAGEAPAKRPDAGLARKILRAAGVTSGLCVHLGGGDGHLTAELARGAKLLVQGLALTPARVSGARRYLQEQGLYGRVSVEGLRAGPLPYASNLANFIVVDDLPSVRKAGVSLREIVRVLAPGGRVFLKRGPSGAAKPLTQAEGKALPGASALEGFAPLAGAPGWMQARKVPPAQNDEWTHPLHGADGNLVSQDASDRIPGALQWITGPTWPMGSKTESTNAAVSAGGRHFSITCNTTENFARPLKEIRWYLVARDAFNGLLLWQRPLEGLHPVVWEAAFAKKKAKAGPSGKNPLWALYGLYGRRPFPLVAVGERVFTAVANRVLVLNARTGETLAKTEDLGSFPGTVLFSEGRLLAATSDALYALDPASGKVRWKFPVLAKDVRAGDGQVFFLDAKKTPLELVALDAAGGKANWRTSMEGFTASTPSREYRKKKNFVRRVGQLLILRFYRKGLLVLANPEGISGVSAKDGKKLWTHKKVNPHTHNPIVEAFYINGRVWVTNAQGGPNIVGLDPATGEVKERFSGSLYHRCQTGVATRRFFISGRFLRYVDLRAQGPKKTHPTNYLGIRGTCRIGVTPANGMVYSYPHGCFCNLYENHGIQAYAPVRPRPAKASPRKPAPAAPASGSSGRLERGAAFPQLAALLAGPKSEAPHAPGAPGASAEWPTFRHDPQRSGHSPQPLPAPGEMKLLWSVPLTKAVAGPLQDDQLAGPSLGDPLSGAVIAGGRIVVAAPEVHQVVALDAATGKSLWRFTAGGRVDAPPTLYRGVCLFGCRDGWVYCLRARDGKLAWRYRAAPEARRIVAFGQLESAWPVPGSVLVLKETAYVAAGRSSGDAGGISILALDPRTGQKRWEKKVSAFAKGRKGGTSALGDVLVSDGKAVYLTATYNPLRFDPETGASSVAVIQRWTRGKGTRYFEPDPPYLAGTALGLRDSTWRREGAALRQRKGQHYCRYGSAQGIFLCFDRQRLCGYLPTASKWGFLEMHGSRLWGRRLDAHGKLVKGEKGWTRTLRFPRQMEALLLAGTALFAAGPLDRFAAAASELWALSSADGKTLKTWKLAAPPVYDGLSAAGGRLYLAARDGQLLCFGKE